ncbi:hypothetical protein DBV15_05038 [Temnothorax longispinosus]|uniref:BED-type domain-containing protein n=1 Tax=Temnothorax longispinosus TaxID=300112 RepID=A0A4S2KQB6_9HYME|nr:hypothetical protein DBV15_05038 [Temnothorax longispinosus]
MAGSRKLRTSACDSTRSIAYTHVTKYAPFLGQRVRKRADVWNKFDVKGNVATCKTCNTTIKHCSDIHLLKRHLLRSCESYSSSESDEDLRETSVDEIEDE